MLSKMIKIIHKAEKGSLEIFQAIFLSLKIIYLITNNS